MFARGDDPGLATPQTGSRPGIRDVAAAVGVSITTVSHALSGKRPVSPGTRASVMEAAERLGYRPNGAAKALRRGRSSILALTVTPIQGYGFHFTMMDYYRQFIDAATWSALGRNYAVIVVPPADGRVWDHLDVAGAIVVDPRTGDLSVSSLRSRGIPIVTLGQDPSNERPHHWVDNDNEGAVRSALDHFVSQGARRTALLASPPVTSYSIDCLASYRVWCDEHDQEPIISLIENANEAAGAEATLRLLGSSEPPDAILGTVDCFGMGVLRAAEDAGIDIPADLMLATWSESEIRRGPKAFVTRLSDFPEMAGSAAIEILIELVEGREPKSPHRRLPTELHIRASTLRSGSAIA